VVTCTEALVPRLAEVDAVVAAAVAGGGAEGAAVVPGEVQQGALRGLQDGRWE
jgi:hypothetical protein